jgi:hypothetical protein
VTRAAALAPGTRIRVRNDWPERHGPVHIRTPHYLRGIEGRIERRLGAFPNPEDLAFARPAATIALYHVAFDAAAVWPEADAEEVLLVEVYDHWLEALP